MGLADLTTVEIMQQFYRWGEFYAVTRGDYDGGEGVRIIFLPQHFLVYVRVDGVEREMTFETEAIVRGMEWAANKYVETSGGLGDRCGGSSGLPGDSPASGVLA